MISIRSEKQSSSEAYLQKDFVSVTKSFSTWIRYC